MIQREKIRSTIQRKTDNNIIYRKHNRQTTVQTLHKKLQKRTPAEPSSQWLYKLIEGLMIFNVRGETLSYYTQQAVELQSKLKSH